MEKRRFYEKTFGHYQYRRRTKGNYRNDVWTNSLLHGWMEDVKLFIFGPAENLLPESESFREYVMDFLEIKNEVIACRFIAEQKGLDNQLKRLGLRVEYVGEKISDLIHQGYIPMVW